MRSLTLVGVSCKPVLPRNRPRVTESDSQIEETDVSINSQSNIAANLQVGPTDQGMVRIYVEGDGIDLPLDFDPEEAAEIAEELMAAVEAARSMAKKGGAKKPKK